MTTSAEAEMFAFFSLIGWIIFLVILLNINSRAGRAADRLEEICRILRERK